MNFTPNHEENETISEEMFPKDEYDFKVVYAKEKKSKSGNDMIEIIVSVYDKGKIIRVYDYLLEAMAFKLKHFCETTGLETAYTEGTLTAKMCVGKTGRCKLEIQSSPGFPDKNIIEDYCKDEEIPF